MRPMQSYQTWKMRNWVGKTASIDATLVGHPVSIKSQMLFAIILKIAYELPSNFACSDRYFYLHWLAFISNAKLALCAKFD